jgi:hypothetical protein
MCDSNCSCGCNSVKIPRGPQGPQGDPGIPGEASAVTVMDSLGNTVTDCTKIIFADSQALVTDLGGGVAEVTFVPPQTVWENVENLDYYVENNDTDLFRPQYTIEGNKITFRGLLYVPLKSGGSTVPIVNSNSYRGVLGVGLGSDNLLEVSNANSVSSERQGRFFTSEVKLPNLPPNAVPQQRDIVFDNVDAYRRYGASVAGGNFIYTYRSVVQLRIGGINTPFYNDSGSLPLDYGIGCISVFSPFQTQYGGSNFSPYGNDPLSLLISNVNSGDTGNNYITATDDFPWDVSAITIPPGGNPFTVNAHKITDLGGFIINLEGLSGYLN